MDDEAQKQHTKGVDASETDISVKSRGLTLHSLRSRELQSPNVVNHRLEAFRSYTQQYDAYVCMCIQPTSVLDTFELDIPAL